MLSHKKEGFGDSDLSLPDLPPVESPNILPPIESPIPLHKNEDLPELPTLPSFPEPKAQNIEGDQNFKTIEMKEWTPESGEHVSGIPEAPLTHETIPDTPDVAPLTQHTSPSFESHEAQETQNSPRQPITQDIFIKIDKFRGIRNALSETQEKLEEIDTLLSKIREIKIREEQELSAWEKELSTAKSRINDINSNIFEKVR